jgi:hypothetical protein
MSPGYRQDSPDDANTRPCQLTWAVTEPSRFVDAQNVQIRNGARLDQARHPVDQTGDSARGYRELSTPIAIPVTVG